MSKILLAFGLLLSISPLSTVHAEVLAVPDGVGESALTLPAKGEAQASVLSRYGEPAKRYAAVGGSSAAQPPITRWDYPGFSVFFENSHVVHAVVPGQPAQLFNTDELSAASGS